MNRMIIKVIHGDWLVRKHFVPRHCGTVLLITTFTLSFIPTFAFAEETPKMGFYASLGLDLSEDSFDKYPGDPNFETGIGFALTVGYRFHPNIAAEGTCEYLNRVDSNDVSPNLEASILSFHGNFKGYLTTTRFQPFLLLGAGVTRFRFEQSGKRDDDVGITGHFGGGFDYYIVPRISVGLTAAYVATSGKIEDLDYSSFTLGAQYRF
jgi:opacity protein-like surface antigen